MRERAPRLVSTQTPASHRYLPRYVALPEDVTYDWLMSPLMRLYRFLNADGEFMSEQLTTLAGAEPTPYQEGSWDRATLRAAEIDARFIVVYGPDVKKVLFRVPLPSGAWAWYPAAPAPHKSWARMNDIEASAREPGTKTPTARKKK